MRTAAKSTIFVASLALAVGALTGCSGGQSVADACKVIADEGQALTSTMNDAMTSASSDPGAAAKALEEAKGKLDGLGEKITNGEVKPVYDDFLEAYGDITEVVSDIAEDPANAADAMTKITDASKKIQDSTKKMQDLCGA